MKLKKKYMLLLLIFFSLVNLALSISIENQKSSNTHNHIGFWSEDCEACNTESEINSCFSEDSEDSGCYKVQTSKYSNTFGISNPVYGIISFSLIFLLLLSLKIAMKNKDKTFLSKNFGNIKMILFFLILGGLLISLWFLILQFFIIGTLCNYCLVVDIIMIVMAFLYAKLIF